MPRLLPVGLLTLQRLQIVHRRYLGTKERDAGREFSIQSGTSPTSWFPFAANLPAGDRWAFEAALRAERTETLQESLDSIDDIDREVLVLRHFEQISNGDCARVLGSDLMVRHPAVGEGLKEIIPALDVVGSYVGACGQVEAESHPDAIDSVGLDGEVRGHRRSEAVSDRRGRRKVVAAAGTRYAVVRSRRPSSVSTLSGRA
jgi:hypothetical protein